MIRLRALLSGLALTLSLVAALALVAMGGAHRFSTGEAEAAAWVYGSAALCGEAGKATVPDCPACHLAGAVVLPEPSGLVLTQELRFVAEVVLPQARAGDAAPLDPSRHLRGPPLA